MLTRQPQIEVFVSSVEDMKKTNHFSKIRSNRVKYLKLFPLFIHDIDQVSNNSSIHPRFSLFQVEEHEDHWPCYTAQIIDDLIVIPDVEQGDKLFRYVSMTIHSIEFIIVVVSRVVLANVNFLEQQLRHHHRFH